VIDRSKEVDQDKREVIKALKRVFLAITQYNGIK
jgi:hypothetical protein